MSMPDSTARMRTTPDTEKVGKRNRPPSSCEPCRIRKLKCNRGLPCDTCIKRKKQSSCEYASNANRNKPNTGRQSNLADRLQNLEKLVFQFLQNGVTLQQPDDYRKTNGNENPSVQMTSVERAMETRGSLHVQGDKTNYVDSSHWLSILDDIKDIREQLSLSNTHAVENEVENEQVDLVFSPMPIPSIREILHSLPPRPVCDSLLSQYFNSRYMILPILHPVKFQKEYELFWEDPPKAPPLWIGLLFAILGVAVALRQVAKMPTESMPSAKTFQLRTAQCLVLGKYFTAKAYGLETLVLHLQSNFLCSVDSNISLWFLMGIVIRLAMRMGYHRDPKNHPSISPFDGEMRRRLWQNIFQLDVLMSFQLGLPSMIPSEYCDTEPPRNLYDSDFDPDVKALPPSRPLSDHTPVLYTIVKGRVMDVFKRIVAHTQSLSSPPYDKTLALDGEIRETYNSIPEAFRMRPISRSFMDASSTIMNRCSIELLYLKGIVVLHRRYLNTDRSNPQYEYSRRACVDAALGILARQADLHQASQPGGQLYEDRWMVSSLTAHDFLLAAMVVCLELSVQMRTEHLPAMSLQGDFARQFEALQTSQRIWASARPHSKDAHTATQALELMIRKVKANTQKSSDAPTANVDDNLMDHVDLPYAEPMTEMIDGSEHLNWTLLDQYFQNHDLPVPPSDPYDENSGLFPIPSNWSSFGSGG
ncbi:hypothetical protein VTN77DRAFT_5586 [Rasamsonia byssochlamydoides]|uniref:uncharacterized protein n=1 Tax=Rasamsonia byssochlamydoides TaxID=89139 RepID=UPI0037428AAD